MHFSRTTKFFCVTALSFSLSNTPAFAAAAAHDFKLITTAEVVDEVSRAQKEQQVKDFLSRSDVRDQLIKHGVNADEASMRVASLSEQELNQLSTQVDEARAGGNILVAILLIVLIIYLVKRL